MSVLKVLIQAELGRYGKQRIFLSVLMLWVITVGNGATAQVQLERFFPPVVAAGAETAVTAEGKFPAWPVSIDCSREDVEISASKDSGKVKVTVGEGAAPGVAWIRFFDSKSVSSLVPILIAPAGVTPEKEPNNNRDDANELKLPAVIAGRLAKSGDSDGFRVRVDGGRPLVVSATAHQVLRSPMDAVMQITDLRGNVLAQSDDCRGMDPQLVYTPDSDQELLIRIFAFPATPNSTVGFGGSASYVYALDVTQGAFLDHAVVAGSESMAFGYNIDDDSSLIVFDDDQISPPTAYRKDTLGWSPLGRSAWGEDGHLAPQYYRGALDVTLPAVVFGHITTAKELHTISFAAKAGTKYRADVRSKLDGFLLDSKLEAVDPESGKVLASNDDVSRGGYDAAVEFTPKSDGNVEIRLTEMLEAFGPRHFYRLSIRSLSPSFSLAVASDRFVLSGDKPLEIPVSIKREYGFTGKIRIDVDGLPAEVSSQSVISEPKGDTAKAVKLKLNPGSYVAGHQTIRVTGRELGEGEASVGAPVVASFPLRPSITIEDLWLTLAEIDKAKDN